MECEIYVQTGSDIRHDQWVARTFSLEGVVRDSLSVSDVNDLSQLTTVEWIKHGSFRWCWSTRAHVVCEHMGCKRIVQSQPEVLGYTEMSDPERPLRPENHICKFLSPCHIAQSRRCYYTIFIGNQDDSLYLVQEVAGFADEVNFVVGISVSSRGRCGKLSLRLREQVCLRLHRMRARLQDQPMCVAVCNYRLTM